jgi:RpiB/LacA/LacB family sugar-phosphate isomerase
LITIKKNILFVCTGNTCRSPFAEVMMRKLVDNRYGENGVDIRVSSAGTYAFTGVTSPPDALKAAESFDVDLSTNKSRSIHLSIVEASDVVFCMTAQHRAHLVAKFPWYEDKFLVLKSYALGKSGKDSGEPEKFNIGDPIGQGPEVYREVYQDIKECLEKVLDRWESEKDFRMKMGQKYRIVAGSDHAGFRLKSHLVGFLRDLGHEVTDFGVESGEESTDYPDYARPVAEAVSQGKYNFGLLVCGSGVGMDITANRIRKVRAVLAQNALLAKLSRQHNNTNVLCLGERFTTPMVAEDIVKTWLSTPYEGGRHEKRVSKIEGENC